MSFYYKKKLKTIIFIRVYTELIFSIFLENNSMSNIFNKHPNEVGETYFQHLIVAWKYGLNLLSLFAIALIHGLLPFIFKKTVSKKIIKMGDELQNRNNNSLKIH